MKPVLEAVHLNLARGKATLLADVSWRIDPGQHWAIVGPHGCGKTSLLRTLTGYQSATSGTISLLGQKYGEADWRDLRRKIGIVTSALQQSIPPAEPAIETVISGRYAQLDLWAKIQPADTRAAARWLKHVGMAALARREWLYLSQGERQRVLIARALMVNPRVLILDEPCSGLDPIARENFLAFLDQVGRRPRSPSLVLVTHHVDEIMPVFTHALLLRAGGVVAAGPRDDVLSSRELSRTFGQSVRLLRRGNRLALRVHPKTPTEPM